MGMSATGGFSFDRYVVVDSSTGGRNPMINAIGNHSPPQQELGLAVTLNLHYFTNKDTIGLHDGELLGEA